LKDEYEKKLSFKWACAFANIIFIVNPCGISAGSMTNISALGFLALFGVIFTVLSFSTSIQ
jgi:hypothetical protein